MKYIIIALLGFFINYNQPNKPIQLSDNQRVGIVPRFTTDEKGNPVLSWAEKDGDKKNLFFFAISKDGGSTFQEKISVKVPEKYSVHAEGMPKIAFKKNGEIIALFEVSKPTPTERFAGNLYFISSKDKGKNWSEPQAIHQDTTAGKSHSFGNLSTLPDGQIGFVWLDEKLGKYAGRSVKYRQTLPNGTLSNEVIVDSNACQCCRTNLFVDADNNFHVLYRDMLADGSRDISHVVSQDGGKTFSDSKVVFDDKWQVNACPHTGPSTTQVGKDIYTAWFTGKEGDAGVHLSKIGSGKLMDKIETNRAKHPQVGVLDNQLVMIWDQSMQKDDKFFTKIGLRIFDKQGNFKEEWISPDFMTSTYPAVMSSGKNLLVAYEQKKEAKDNSVIVVQRLSDLVK
jgi:BNR repeat-like domain